MSTLRDNGDLFERRHWKWIESRLPLYEEIWDSYIGNDGSSHPSPQMRIPADKQPDWKIFYQSHYSFAVYAYLFDVHTDSFLANLKASAAERKKGNPTTYLRTVKHLTTYLALLGQIRDMVEEMATALKSNDLAVEMEEFGSQRDNAIHTAVIPMADSHDGVLIPAIAKANAKGDGEWRKHTPWHLVDRAKFHPLHKWVGETRDELFSTIRKPLYPMIRKSVVARFGKEPVAVVLEKGSAANEGIPPSSSVSGFYSSGQAR